MAIAVNDMMGPESAMQYDNKRRKLESMRLQLSNERSSFIEHWREIGSNISPRRQRYFTTDTNKGNRRNDKIIDSTATTAMRTLSAGMMGGLTSPAREWFKLGVRDPQMMEDPQVKIWLDEVNRRMRLIFNGSNLYQALPNIYSDCGTFGTAAMMAEEDIDKVIRFYTFPIGSYMIACDEKLQVNVFFREFRMTVRQLVGKFQARPNDWTNFSDTIKQLWTNNQRDTWIDIYHVIYPNDEFDPQRMESRYKKFSSCYWEKGSHGASSAGGPSVGDYQTGSDKDTFLRESGYDLFPVMVPRWQVAGEDVYGTDCPGMLALGDVKQLQMGWKRILQAIEKSINPPTKAPQEMKSMVASVLAGGISWTSEASSTGKFEPVYQIDPRIGEMMKVQEGTQARIKHVCFEDLFLMMSMDSRTQPPTAEEVIEKRAEKMLGLGPVVEQFDQDLMNPLIKLTYLFGMMQQAFPPPPIDGMTWQDMKVEFVSIMAQAQKILGVANKERFVGFVIRQATEGQQPQILDNVNFDEIVQEYADALGIEQKNLHTPEEVAQARAARAQQQQAAQHAQLAEQMGNTAKSLSQADMKGDSALTRLLGSKEAALSPTV